MAPHLAVFAVCVFGGQVRGGGIILLTKGTFLAAGSSSSQPRTWDFTSPALGSGAPAYIQNLPEKVPPTPHMLGFNQDTRESLRSLQLTQVSI